MPDPQTLLKQVTQLEQMCRAVGMVQAETVLAVCTKLREVVEAAKDMRAWEVAKQLVVHWGSEWAVIDEAAHLSESHLISLQQRIAYTLTAFAAQQVAQAKRETWGDAARMYCDLCKMGLSERRLDGEWVHHSRNLAANNSDDAFCESPGFRRCAQEVL